MKTYNPLCDMCGYIMPHDKWAWVTVKRRFTSDPLTLCRECCDKLKERIEKRNAEDAKLIHESLAARAGK